MKYQNWRSYLSKSLFILFLGISILLVKLFSKSILKHELDDLYINYLLDGMIFLYGIVLILIYLIINKKYIYLLNYGLLYAIIGCCLMFVSPTIESYLDSANIHFTVINKFEETPKIVKIQATIHVEHESQKGILIGKKGLMLKNIGTQAREEIEELVENKVFLELFVKVSKNWRKNSNLLKDFGYVQEQ